MGVRVGGAVPAGEGAAERRRAGFGEQDPYGNTLDRAMEVLEANIERESMRPHLVTVQEVPLGPRQLEDARRRARSTGYAACLHAAAPTGHAAPARSGGVGVLVREDLQARGAQGRVPGDFKHRMFAEDLVHKAGPTSSVICGRTVTGAADRDLRGGRVTASLCAGRRPRGAALGLRLRCAELRNGCGQDPLVLHSGQLSLPLLRGALEAAASRQASAAATWVHCSFPVDAAAFALGRIGWYFRPERCLITDAVDVLDLALVGPREPGVEASRGARLASDRHEMRTLASASLFVSFLRDAPKELIGPGGKRGERERPPADKLNGKLYVDGSSVVLQFCALGRAGWAFAQCDDDGSLFVGVYGTAGRGLRPQQSARGCEDAAVWVVNYAGPAVEEFDIDCHGTAECSRRGLAYAMGLSWSRSSASFELGSSRVCKVAAHGGRQAGLDGRFTDAQRRSNLHADRLAKLEAQLRAEDALTLGVHCALAGSAQEQARWVGQAAVFWQHFAEKGSDSFLESDERRQVRVADQEERTVPPTPCRPLAQQLRVVCVRSEASAVGLSIATAGARCRCHPLVHACCDVGGESLESVAGGKRGARMVLDGQAGGRPKFKEPCIGVT
ncbi:unnamed protein product, partial [Prorocentrum cordatum]